jgi:transposase
MNSVEVKRLDHHGLVASVINDLKIVEIIDERIQPDDQEAVSTGEAVKAMILNGLGFSNRPLMLTPQFYENLPTELLFRKGVKAEHFNRHKLGRALDGVFSYGCDVLFSEIALYGCQREEIEMRFNSLDTTAFSLTGDYLGQTGPEDLQAIKITQGHSKDHRPDLKQAVLELLVSQDGGVPIISKAWDGNASDNVVFKERAEALIDVFKNTDAPRYLVADSKLYAKKSAPFLAQIPYITRIPGTLALERKLTDQALRKPTAWVCLGTGYRYQRVDLTHYGINQRWLVIHSESALERAKQTLAKAEKKEHKKANKQLSRLQAQRFGSQKAARQALDEISESLTYHQTNPPRLIRHKTYAKRGRPGPDTPVKASRWQIKADLTVDQEKIEQLQQQKACFIVGTSIPKAELTDAEVFTAYKNQSKVEHGYRFLKDPLFFVSSLFLKKPSRIEGLLMVMTLALLVYSIAQRRLRKQLQAEGETLPNQIDIPTAKPTLRWIFQILDGVNRVIITINGSTQMLIEGVTDLRMKILRLFGPSVCRIYQVPCPGG